MKPAPGVCKSFMQLSDFSLVSQMLNHASILVADALVISQLDYCNSFFRDPSMLSLCK